MQMPNKLKLVLGLSAVSVMFDVLSKSWISAIVGGLIIFALFKGHEAVRSFLVWGSALGFCILSVAMVLSLIALPFSLLTGPIVAIGSVLALGFSMLRCALTVWVLRERDVQQWMYARSAGAL